MYDEAYFSQRLPQDPRREVVWYELNRFFSAFYPETLDQVVELGAAYCHWINAVDAKKKWAVDVSPLVAAYANQNTTPVIRDAKDLTFLADASVDMVLASNFFEHFTTEDVQSVLREVHRTLRTGGRLCILQPNFRYASREYFDDYTHRAIFTHDGFCGLLQAQGFQVVRSWPRLTPYSFKSSKITIPKIFVRWYLHSPIRPGAKQMAIIVEKREM